jgi:hypothetical protein
MADLGFKLASLIKETTTTQGTGTLTLAGAVTDFLSFGTALGLASGGDNAVTHYGILAGSVYEFGEGVALNTGSGFTLSRLDVFASSNGGSLVNLAPGTKTVICPAIGQQMLVRDADNIVGRTDRDLHVKADDLTLEVSGAGKILVVEPTFTTSVLWHLSRFANTNGTKGSVKLGSLIVNWNTINVGADSSLADTMQTAFPTAFDGAQVSYLSAKDSTTPAGRLSYSKTSTTQITVHNGDTAASDVTYLAWGR